MKQFIQRSPRTILMILLACFLSVSIGCGSKSVVIPDSREIIDLSKGCKEMPGWYGISGGYLKELSDLCGAKE
jgi:hypothetical protein